MTSKPLPLILSSYTSPIAKMVIISDDQGVYLLEFEGRKNLQKDIDHLCAITKRSLIEGETYCSKHLKGELDLYFAGKLKTFKTPVHMIGTPFQKAVWKTLLKIPYGKTISYLEEATLLGNPNAFRAVANANGKNRLAIIIPCHRVIHKNGKLGGYGGGIERKKWLLKQEQVQ
ncbi:MAG: Methylated-DNA--protein-cysteine methyltransferase [Chlamydiia bacterium]|nr:Methylated-DNA--protein-cysteine methyltransferase [Chlamydiia bacterium]MCH9618801.1 Methylated-DNA--protein-cysteine methyltransferase [Chlamydiia bacterium]MCH9624606.1 Methylated-DNA--protein-cysteine methyltransferase [Chlamydiia bacterium]